MGTDPIREAASAKINLALHVTGQRADGYHLLDSIVAFTEVGDEVVVEPAEHLSLTIEGPFAKGLDAGPENLVLRAARALGAGHGAKITLVKNLPVASGIGGGSADAAATLRALSRLWRMPLPEPDAILALGADVPVCLSAEPARMTGIGEDIERLGPPPSLDFVLVNPGVAVSTAAIFRALPTKVNPALPDDMPDLFETEAWIGWLSRQRNDLLGPAVAEAPVIAEVLDALSALPGCLLARMSGSGATCFGLFSSTEAAEDAATAISDAHPDWWVKSSFEAPV